jgi:hypothetical protein
MLVQVARLPDESLQQLRFPREMSLVCMAEGQARPVMMVRKEMAVELVPLTHYLMGRSLLMELIIRFQSLLVELAEQPVALDHLGAVAARVRHQLPRLTMK